MFVFNKEKTELIQLPFHTKIVSVSSGHFHHLLLNSEGKVYAHGNGKEGKLGLGDERHRSNPTLISSLNAEKIIQIEAAPFHSAALSENGNVYCWGNGKYGQIGSGKQSNCLLPFKVEILHSKIVQICCEDFSTSALTIDGHIYTWGFRFTPIELTGQSIGYPKGKLFLFSNLNHFFPWPLMSLFSSSSPFNPID